jgi:hypothetical protein
MVAAGPSRIRRSLASVLIVGQARRLVKAKLRESAIEVGRGMDNSGRMKIAERGGRLLEKRVPTPLVASLALM